jgi:hypothetical protein
MTTSGFVPANDEMSGATKRTAGRNIGIIARHEAIQKLEKHYKLFVFLCRNGNVTMPKCWKNRRPLGRRVKNIENN